ncbi:uncharacterized protein LOC126907525 isoform X2 [Daktulosphaira vitifoliae]|uniref:uncharacterized protein LOC126907525 isoform X2 n=1 Tax=Daktulosphaira vitifoliae TaxID=58002 RepID=UPI0021AA11E4|nr:uncharacterized protein LOC126907525 isoform X2 [Daktulosphaira vitifoliae]
MMKLRLYITLFLYTKCAISLDHLELHCNFSKHLFKFFKYSEKYLFNFENNISELELRNYGTAVKSHGDIVMIMLDSLREMDEKYIAADIMTVNLYLNNVSGSINMIGKDEHGKLNKSKNSQNLLKGYKILHRSIVERLEYFINDKCLKVSVQNDFTSLTNFNEPIKYSSAVLLNELEKLNSKIIRNMKEYLTLRDIFVMDNNIILNNYCDIVKNLALTFEKKSYKNFNPKNILFYDLMENQVNNVLDIVRYVPLKLKNNNNQQIKLSDMFHFIKFDFNFQNVQVFLNLLYIATARPIMLIVRLYIFLVHNFVLIFKSQVSESKTIMKDKIIELGQQIIKKLLGNHEDIYRSVFFHSINTRDIKKHSHSTSDENDEMNNDDDMDFDVTAQTYYTPKYLVDYLLYE